MRSIESMRETLLALNLKVLIEINLICDFAHNDQKALKKPRLWRGGQVTQRCQFLPSLLDVLV